MSSENSKFHITVEIKIDIAGFYQAEKFLSRYSQILKIQVYLESIDYRSENCPCISADRFHGMESRF